MIAEAATIDVLYVAFNRLEMTRESFGSLVRNTDWSHVSALLIADDGSTDGTLEWLIQAAANLPVPVLLFENCKGPVGAINGYLDDPGMSAETFLKIDNDFVVSPGYLDVALRLHYLNPDIDLIGFEPMKGHPQPYSPELERTWVLHEARHIGGKGLIRRRAFERSGCRPWPHGEHGYQGFTQWQTKHRNVPKAWISPDLCCFGLDQLPFEPWRSLTTRYVEEGWQRRWGEYDELDTTYWQWWVDQDPARIAE